ncbi:MAG: NAD(P)-binding domain-containing protein, partial [Gammaproteobacteria bacterium]|nr:NAD(P)-binding domain-containing protein [Gammaproteobacteria bacterium]
MPEQQIKTIAVIGAGSLGLGLARLFADQSFQVRVGSRSPRLTNRRIAELIGSQPPGIKVTGMDAAANAADICLLTVSDDAITKVCM